MVARAKRARSAETSLSNYTTHLRVPRSGGPRRSSFEPLNVKRRIPELFNMPKLLGLYSACTDHGKRENTALEGFTGDWSRDPNLRSLDLRRRM